MSNETKKTLTVKEASEAYQALEALIIKDNANSLIFSGAVRCKLALGLRKTKPVAELFMNENNRLVEKYGEEELAPNKDGGDPIKTGRHTINAKSPNWEKFREEYKAFAEGDSEVSLQPIAPHELYGVTPEQFNDKDFDPKSCNQLSTELVAVLYQSGILTE